MRSHPHPIQLNPQSGLLCISSLSYENILYPHHHESFELTLISDGVHEVETETETIRLTRGDLLLLRSNEPHARRMIEKGRYHTLAFPVSEIKRLQIFLDDELAFQNTSVFSAPRAQLSSAETECMIRRMENINLFITASPARAIYELRVLLSECCSLFLTPRYENTHAVPWLSRILREMSSPENIRLGLSAMISLSPYTHEYTCREFRRLIGCTPTEYINSLRLDRAHTLIETTSMTISDICAEVGFESLSYFHKLFRQKYGLPPAGYRKVHFVSRPNVPYEQQPDPA